MAYPTDKWTDKELSDLEKRIAEVYKQAEKDLDKEVKEYFAKFALRDKEMQQLVQTGDMTPADYQRWRMTQIGRGKRFEALRDKVAERYTQANEVANAYVNDLTPSIYSLNRNYEAYTIEKAVGSCDFTMWDESTVRRLLVEQPDVMPYYPLSRAFNRGIDLAYGKSQITKHVTSGIIRGLAPGKIANELMANLTGMNRSSAVRAARTGITAAQNAGRMDSYVAAEKMGIQIKRRWVCTKDSRTRTAHQGVEDVVGTKEPFDVDGEKMMFPGDTSMGASGWNIYNCRCSMRTVEKDGIEAEPRQMRVRDPVTGKNVLVNEMTYAEWQKWKETGVKPEATTAQKSTLAQTKGDIKKQIADVLEVGVDKIDIGQLSTKAQDVILGSIKKTLDKFPQIKGHFNKIGVDGDADAIAVSKSLTGEIKVGKKFFEFEKLEKDYNYGVKLKWHPDGTTAQSAITHEIGHQIDGLLTIKRVGGGYVDKYGAYRTSSEIQKQLFDEFGITDALKDFRKQYRNQGYTGGKLNHAVMFERKELITKHSCEYAAENANELFACLYAEYMDSPHPRPMAKRFGEILEGLMGEVK